MHRDLFSTIGLINVNDVCLATGWKRGVAWLRVNEELIIEL